MSQGLFFDVEPFRRQSGRVAVRRQVERPTLVLGSTQPDSVVEERALAGAEVARRRGGGGAVLLQPGDHLWLDVWVPRADVLWGGDVTAAAAWVGEWWVAALSAVGASEVEAHHGRLVPGELGQLVCFASRGPGEVFSGARKLMGLSQWRSREGSLFSACAYTRWDPTALVGLLAVEEPEALTRGLAAVAIGMEELAPAVSMDALSEALLSTFDDWGDS